VVIFQVQVLCPWPHFGDICYFNCSSIVLKNGTVDFWFRVDELYPMIRCGGDTPTIAPSQYRGLQLYDPRIVTEYENTLSQQLRYHKLEDKINELYNQAKNQQ